MGETTDQIERHIHETRNELSDNINELQQKVKTTFDWRAQFQQSPMALTGAAFGGGLLLSLILPKHRSSHHDEDHERSGRFRSEGRRLEYPAESRSAIAQKTQSVWDSFRAALLTTGISRLTGFVEELLPGFQEQFRKRQGEADSQSQNLRRPNGPEESSESRPGWRRIASGETDFGHNA